MGITATSEAPEPRISVIWKTILIGLASVVDFLKFLFSILAYAAPFIAGFFVKFYLQAHHWPVWIANLSGVVVGASTAAAEVVLTPIAAAIAFLGIILAMATGFIGWLILIVILLVKGVNPFAPKSLKTTLIGWGVSEIPFLNIFPATVGSVVAIIRKASEQDKEKLAKWKKEQAASEAARRTNIQQIQAAERARVMAAQMEAQVANDNEVAAEEEEEADEIPERQRLAA